MMPESIDLIVALAAAAGLILLFLGDLSYRGGQRPRPPRYRPLTPAEPSVQPPKREEGQKTAAPEPAVVPEPSPVPETVEPVPPAPVEEPAPPVAPVNFLERIRAGLGKTRASLADGLAGLLAGQKTLDEDLLEEVGDQLLMADVGVTATNEVIDQVSRKLAGHEVANSEALYGAFKQELQGLLADSEQPLVVDTDKAPYVILMVGVNGAGKTTTIGKLARRFQAEGKRVMLAAGDTFRAAAVEQLEVWGERNQVPVVAQHTGADSASVIYDALESARARNFDVLIADTAGRLQNKENLMAELGKICRVMKKLDAGAPHEIMLVVDAGTGQNALSQARLFNQAVGVTGITLTKLDGTAKGGIIFAIAKELGLPIRFIGVGETIDDLRPFKSAEFVSALFDTQPEAVT